MSRIKQLTADAIEHAAGLFLEAEVDGVEVPYDRQLDSMEEGGERNWFPKGPYQDWSRELLYQTIVNTAWQMVEFHGIALDKEVRQGRITIEEYNGQSRVARQIHRAAIFAGPIDPSCH